MERGKAVQPVRKVFQYKARDANGKIRSGAAIASSSSSVRRSLAGKGYTIEAIIENKSLWKKLSQSNRISPKERSIFYRELGTMLKAGLSITQSIAISSETPNKRLKRVLVEIAKSLENGFSLSVAMTSFPKTFPAVEIGVVKAGEATGNLAKVLRELSVSTHRSADFSSKVKGAMVYPAFIMVVLVIVGSVILVKVIPPIKDIFDESGQDLPVTTKILLGVTSFLQHDWYWLLLGVVTLVILYRLFSATKPGKQFNSTASLSFPVFGELVRDTYLARFSRTLSLLVSAGVPIIEAIEIIRESTTNVIFNKMFYNLNHALEQGSAISTALRGEKYFPKLMTQLLYVGQQSGDLAGISSTLADYYEEEVDSKLKVFSSLLEPFIIVIMGVGVGFVIISVLQPIYNLTGAIQ